MITPGSESYPGQLQNDVANSMIIMIVYFDNHQIPPVEGSVGETPYMSIKRIALLIMGHVSIALGLIGIFIPVLPTTPFLLLASYCFYKSSDRLHAWLMNHPLLGEKLRNYFEHRSVSRRTKITAIAFLWTSLLVSMILINIGYVRVIMAFVGTAVTVHLLALRTMPDLPISDHAEDESGDSKRISRCPEIDSDS